VIAISRKRDAAFRFLEKVFLISGIALLGIYALALVAGRISSSVAVAGFKAAHAATPSSTVSRAPIATGNVDVSLWSGKRVQAYLVSLTTKKDPAVGILRIPRLRIEVPIFEGTDDLTLNRGVGHIVGTADLGSPGNAGIAGHRDGFFRVLKDIVNGDKIELSTASRILQYEVQRTEIVLPSETSVLADRGSPALTLVTCFPFYFDGDAPQRFIVHAALADIHGRADPSGARSNQFSGEGMERKHELEAH
jgi:sortase A